MGPWALLAKPRERLTRPLDVPQIRWTRRILALIRVPLKGALGASASIVGKQRRQAPRVRLPHRRQAPHVHLPRRPLFTAAALLCLSSRPSLASENGGFMSADVQALASEHYSRGVSPGHRNVRFQVNRLADMKPRRPSPRRPSPVPRPPSPSPGPQRQAPAAEPRSSPSPLPCPGARITPLGEPAAEPRDGDLEKHETRTTFAWSGFRMCCAR